MKKRLLITSIVMMLVVAVALSTATYAWFTSNATVSATSVTMTASTSDTAALAIGWGTSNVSYGSQITTTAIGNDVVFAPVAPTTITANTAIADFTFGTAHIQTLNNANYFTDVEAATAAESNTNVYKWAGKDSTNADTTIISIKNTSTVTTTRNITVTADITPNTYSITKDTAVVSGKTYYTRSGSDPDYTYTKVESPDTTNIATYYESGADMIRVAVFKEVSGTYQLVGIMSNPASKIAYGSIAAPQNKANPQASEVAEKLMHISESSTNATLASTGLALSTLAPTASMNIKVCVWMDGQALGDNEGGLDAKIALSFTEDAAPAQQGNGD